MKVLIIEDEKTGHGKITRQLKGIEDDITVAASCGSLEEGIDWIEKNPQPDLVLMEIQLRDGLAFDIFKSCRITCPVIYLADNAGYLAASFEYNGIGYLQKPVNRDMLKNAVIKYKNLKNHFEHNHAFFANNGGSPETGRSRILVKRGEDFLVVKMEDIAYFFTQHKLVFLVDRENNKYVADINNLSELGAQLDDRFFYRANRKYIINVNFIKRFKTLEKSKISLELLLPLSEEIIVSQENSGSFRNWIGEIQKDAF